MPAPAPSLASSRIVNKWLGGLTGKKATIDSLKLDLVLFNTDGAVYRRMLVDMAPVRAAKTVVKTFVTDGDCAQLGKVLVNEVTACTPGDAAACQDQLALSSRVKNVRLYK